MSRNVYVGIIKMDEFDAKTLVNAENAADAKAKVLEKFKDDLGKTFTEKDVDICLFSDVYK